MLSSAVNPVHLAVSVTCYIVTMLLHCRLVLETDAPALGPDKTGVNVPANISIACAEVRAM
jgi:Tat protein secretion system quality control protein TatD with DNase activity